MNRRFVWFGIVVLSWILVGSIMYSVAQTQLSTMWLMGGPYPGAPDYTIWVEGLTYYAKDAWGQIDYSGTNKTDVQQDAITALSSNGIIANLGITMNSSLTWANNITVLEDGVEYYENIKYKLYVAMTNPSTVGYFYGTTTFTANETTFIFGSDYIDIGTTSPTTTPILNLPAASLNNLDYPIGVVVTTGETVAVSAGSPRGGIMFIELSTLDDITNAKALWFKRLHYLYTTEPTRYEEFFEAAQDREYRTITVTNTAILGLVSYNAILGADLFLNQTGVAEVNMFALAGASYSGAVPTWDYGYITRVALAPMRPIAGRVWQMKGFSSASWTNASSNLYFEVYDNLPSWWAY